MVTILTNLVEPIDCSFSTFPYLNGTARLVLYFSLRKIHIQSRYHVFWLCAPHAILLRLRKIDLAAPLLEPLPQT